MQERTIFSENVVLHFLQIHLWVPAVVFAFLTHLFLQIKHFICLIYPPFRNPISKEDSTLFSAEISSIQEDFINTFCPPSKLFQTSLNPLQHVFFNVYNGFYQHFLSYNSLFLSTLYLVSKNSKPLCIRIFNVYSGLFQLFPSYNPLYNHISNVWFSGVYKSKIRYTKSNNHISNVWFSVYKKPWTYITFTVFLNGGEREIRTPDTVSRIHAFQACSLSRSDISPNFITSLVYHIKECLTRLFFVI